MKDQTATPPAEVNETDGQRPTAAAGHDQGTAETLVGLDEACEKRARALEALGTEGRDRLAARYAAANKAVDDDPICRAERAASRKAYRAWKAALDDGEPIEVARERAAQACGRSDLRFDYGERAGELRREAFTAPRGNGRERKSARGARTQPRSRQRRETGGRRSSSGGGDSGDDGLGESSEPPPPGRPCQCGCGQDVSHRAAQAFYLNTQHAAADRQRRKRDRDQLNGVPGLAKRCGCKPKRNPLEPGVCHQCGHARGRLTADWVHDPGPSSRQLVIRDLTRRKWKTGDGKRHEVKRRKVQPRQEVAA